MMRIFKLARRSVGLQAMAHTMKKSYKQLCLLLLFVFMGMLIFGSLCYFAEKDVDGSGYTSIPESMWWAIQTLTSVGYGDLYPTSFGGKLVGVACAVSGTKDILKELTLIIVCLQVCWCWHFPFLLLWRTLQLSMMTKSFSSCCRKRRRLTMQTFSINMLHRWEYINKIYQQI